MFVFVFMLRIESRVLCIPSKCSNTAPPWLLVVGWLGGLHIARTEMTKLEAEPLPHLQQSQVIRWQRQRLPTKREAAAFLGSGKRFPRLAF